MAKIKIDGFEEISKKITELGAAGEAIGRMAVYDGAKVIADELRKKINGLPTEDNRLLIDGDKFNVITARDKTDLVNSMGVSGIMSEADGVRTVIGFAGYGRRKTKKYPNGLPMAMLARSIESGSSVREKHPFIRKAVNAKKKEAIRAMIERAEYQIKTTMER